MDNTQQWKTIAVGLIFAIVTGLAGMCGKICSSFMVPLFVLLIRYTLSFTGNFALQKAGIIHVSLKGKKHKKILILNAVVYSSCQLVQLLGLLYTPSFMNGIMFATVPIWVEILSRIVLKEKSPFVQYIFMGISMLSVIAMLVIGAGGNFADASIKGTLLLLASCLLEAVNNIVIRFLRNDYNPMEIGFSAAGISVIILAVLILLQGSVFGFPDMASAIKSPTFLASVSYLGICCTLIAGITKGYVYQHMSGFKASAFNYVNTVVGFIAGVLFMHEVLHLYHIVCTIFIIIGVAGVQLCKNKNLSPEK